MIRAYSSTYSHTYMPPTSIFEQTSSTGQWLPEQQRDDLVMKCLRRNFLLWSKRSKALLSPTYPLPITYVLQKCATAKSLKKVQFWGVVVKLITTCYLQSKETKMKVSRNCFRTSYLTVCLYRAKSFTLLNLRQIWVRTEPMLWI